MPKQTIRINTIAGGLGSTLYDNAEGTYHAGLAIDPAAQSASTILTSGSIRPIGYSKFSGTEFTGAPMWITAQPKTENSYILASDGKFHSFDNTIVMRATDEAGTSFPIQMNGAGNGMAYYDNFIYCAGTTNIDQYGGLDQGATIARTANVWTGAKFGLTALTNTTYPSMRGIPIPNHAMHVHNDNALYICDVLPAGAGATLANKGTIHKLKTKRTTFQGDTNDGSQYNVLDLPYGFYPTDIESWGTDLVIAAIQTSGASTPKIMQGKAALFFWDTISSSFYRQVYLHDPLCTALLNMNGTLYVFTGDAISGSRVSTYAGGESVQELFYFVEGVSPFAGAVDNYADRLIFGGYISYPQDAACVLGYGNYDGREPKALQNIVRWSGSGSTPTITAAKYIEQHVSINTPRLITGWSDGSAKGLDKFSGTATLNSEWRSQVYNVGRKFKFRQITLNTDETVQTNCTITLKLYTDNNFSSAAQTLTTIDTTTYSGDSRVNFKRPELTTVAQQNFCIGLTFTGTRATAITLPLDIVIDVFDDDKSG